MANKQYSKTLKNAHDARGKQAIINLFKRHEKYRAVPYEKVFKTATAKYKEDLCLIDMEERVIVGLIEVEVRTKAFKNGKFIFSEVNIPKRKLKFFNNKKYKVYYFQLDNNLKNAIVATSKKILKEYKEVKLNNKYMKGEDMLQVPIEHFKTVRL
jgi:hypothetical protein